VVAALMQRTQSIPIVFFQVVDPVGQGFVTNLARPGANVTGFTNFEPTMGSKWLELLKETAPRVARVALIYNPDTAPLPGSFLAPSPLRPPQS
jgi:putative tryptophan/tyrosine transport system substrate-binding protein